MPAPGCIWYSCLASRRSGSMACSAPAPPRPKPERRPWGPVDMNVPPTQDEGESPARDATEALLRELPGYPLLDALLHRRSRRFSLGMNMTAAPLAFRSASEPLPLAAAEEAALAFAACGVTGHALAELPYTNSGDDALGGGNVITHFVARSVPSGDAIHAVAMVVINDGGAWLLRRPQEYPRSEIPQLVQAARDTQLVQLYTQARTRIADHRPQVPREVPHVPPFNTASTNLDGTTVFVPITELTT